MVQFWAHSEVFIVHCCVLQFAYCAVVMAEDFDAMQVCCETVVTCIELEICNFLFSGLVFVVFPCGFNVWHCVLLDEVMASWENFSCVFLLCKSLNCFKVGLCLFFLKCGAFFC
jgi:hypothetical protein